MIFDATYLIFAAFLFILGGLALFIYSILKREKEIQQKETKTITDYKQIINTAQGNAQKLFDSTATSSAQILQDTHATSEHMEETLDTILHSMAQKHIHQLNEQSVYFQKAYDTQMKLIQQEFQKHAQDMVGITEKGLHQSLDNFTQSLVGKTAASEALIDKRTKELLEQIEIEAAEYKKVRIRKLETQIKGLVQRTYTEVLHRTIPETLHEEIIVEALEKAKKDGMFTV